MSHGSHVGWGVAERAITPSPPPLGALMSKNVSLRVWGHGEPELPEIQGLEPEEGASP